MPSKTTLEAPESTRPAAGLEKRGPEVENALSAAQSATKSNLNTATSASGYARLVRAYDEERKGEFTNRISGVLTSGASLTPRIQEDGKVETQTSETYTAKWEATKPEKLQERAAILIREGTDESKGDALVITVDAPMSRALQASNPELTPAIVKQNEVSRTTQEFMALNKVSPLGDPATGRPVFAQAWLDNAAGGQIAVYGFKKTDGGKTAYAGLLPGLDSEGGRQVSLVANVEFTPGLTAEGTRSIGRVPLVPDTPIPIETPEQQRRFLATMEAAGWRPITTAPPENADLPAKFRGLSEVDVSSRASLAIAQAVKDKDVILRGLQFAQTGDPELLKGLKPFEQGLVQDYAILAQRLQAQGGLKPAGVKEIFTAMDKPMRALGELKATVEELRRDPAAMDSITDIRVLATDLAQKNGKSLQDVYRLFDNPEESFKTSLRAAFGPRKAGEMVKQYTAEDNIRKAVMEQLAKDLTDELQAWPSPRGEVWRNAEGKEHTFPDGTPRTATPFDGALAKAGANYDLVREKYQELMKASLKQVAMFDGIRLMLSSRTVGAALSSKEASDLARDYTNHQMTGKPMNPAEKALVERILGNAGPATAYLDETKRLYAYQPLVAAHRNGFSPAEFQRAMVANAQDMEPWSVGVKSYQVYSYNSVPVPSQAALYIAPEQDLPKTFNPSDPEQVREIAAARTWRVVQLANEDGRPTPNLKENGLSTAEMIALRLDANTKNIPVIVARKPLPENAPLGVGLSKTFNLPVVNSADPIDGTPGRYAVVGMKVTGSPVASTVNPGYYKAINFSKAPVVSPEEPVQILDEADFAASFSPERAKKLVEGHKNAEDLRSTLEAMASPERENGVYKVRMTPEGIQQFAADRTSAIQAMKEVRISAANQEFAIRTKGLPPDLRGEQETKRAATVRAAEETALAKGRELGVLTAKIQAFLKENQGKTGYFGLAPSLGVGNPAVRIHKPPMELRFPDGGLGLEESKSRLNKQGLNVDLDAYRLES